jgi:hypothetical protein
MKDRTVEQPVDLVETFDPSLKKQKNESHAEAASDSTSNVEKTTDKEVDDEGTAHSGDDPTAEAGKKVSAGGTQVKEVAKATGFTSTQSPAAEVIDCSGKVASFVATASFPMASIWSLLLIHQLEGMIQVCPSSSPRDSSCYAMASRDSPRVKFSSSPRADLELSPESCCL